MQYHAVTSQNLLPTIRSGGLTMVEYIFKTNGIYFGFIHDNSLFSRDGIYLGWIETRFVSDSNGHFRGYKFILRNMFLFPPLPKIPSVRPPSPPIPPHVSNIPPIIIPVGFKDAFNGN